MCLIVEAIAQNIITSQQLCSGRRPEEDLAMDDLHKDREYFSTLAMLCKTI